MKRFFIVLMCALISCKSESRTKPIGASSDFKQPEPSSNIVYESHISFDEAITPFQKLIPVELKTDKTDPWLKTEGGMTSNGGQVVACDGRAPILLDYYEAKNQWDLKPDLGPQQLDWQDKVKFVLYRLSTKDDVRAMRYLTHLEYFEKNIRFVDGLLDIVSDNNGTVIESECHLAQIALRRQTELPGDKLYTISRPLWDKLDSENKAGLVLHEIILNEAIDWKQVTSRKSRYFNAQLSSDKFLSLSLNEYETLLKISEIFPGVLTQRGQFSFLKNSLTFDENRNVIKGEIRVAYSNTLSKFESLVEVPVKFGSIFTNQLEIDSTTFKAKLASGGKFEICIETPERNNLTAKVTTKDCTLSSDDKMNDGFTKQLVVEINHDQIIAASHLSIIGGKATYPASTGIPDDFVTNFYWNFSAVWGSTLVPLEGKDKIELIPNSIYPVALNCKMYGGYSCTRSYSSIPESILNSDKIGYIDTQGNAPIEFHANGRIKSFFNASARMFLKPDGSKSRIIQPGEFVTLDNKEHILTAGDDVNP